MLFDLPRVISNILAALIVSRARAFIAIVFVGSVLQAHRFETLVNESVPNPMASSARTIKELCILTATIYPTSRGLAAFHIVGCVRAIATIVITLVFAAPVG